MELDPEHIKLLFTVGVIFLSWVKYCWDKLQEREDEFYPDGLNKCPPDTYPLKDGERVTCISCPRCPEGMEPTPPCGTTLAVELTGECVPCRAGMFSAKVDSAACTACTDCGSRETLIPCTAERDSVCKECPWLHFEDQESNTCKHCDFCCGRSSSAHIECITSKTCKVNCLHTASTKRKFAQSILRRRVAKASNLRNTSSSLLSKVPLKDRQERSIRNENAVEKENETLFLLELLDRPEYVQFENGRHYEDKTNSLSNQDLDDREIDDLQMLHLRDFDNSVRQENSHRPITEQKDKNTSARSIPGAISVNSTQKEEDLSLSTTLRPIMPMPTARDQTLRGTSPPTQVTNRILLVPTPSFHQQKPKLINVPSLFSSFIGTLAAVAVVGLLVLIAYIVYKKCSHKIRGEYKRLGSKNNLGEEDIVDDDIDKGKEESSRNKTIEDMSDTAKVVEDLNLCDIPPDLEDILVEGLEEQHGRGQNKMYGWQKVGKEAGIPRQELNFYETAYRRPDSFPTKLLLEKLGTQGKTISYLLDVLQRPMMWCVWKLPQEQNASPDGFNQCPDLSYRDQNDKNVTVQCKTCPLCSPGYEPSPECGSAIFSDTPTVCTICGPKTYSEEYDSACKKCLRCGLRKTISPCTVKKSTHCGNCPRGHYYVVFRGRELNASSRLDKQPHLTPC